MCGIFLANFLEDALPEVVSEGHGVGFVAHADALQAVLPGVVEGVANDALDAFAGVDVFLDGDLVGSALLEEAADADVEPLGVLAKDDQADVAFGAVAKRGQTIVEQFHRPGVDVEIELEAQAQQNVGGVLIDGHARVAQRAEEDGVEFIAKHFDGAGGQRDAFPEVLVGAPVELDELDVAAGSGSGRLAAPSPLQA